MKYELKITSEDIEDKNDFIKIINADKYECFLSDFENELRRHYKYVEHDEKTTEFIEEIREKYFDLKNQWGLNFE